MYIVVKKKFINVVVANVRTDSDHTSLLNICYRSFSSSVRSFGPFDHLDTYQYDSRWRESVFLCLPDSKSIKMLTRISRNYTSLFFPKK